MRFSNISRQRQRTHSVNSYRNEGLFLKTVGLVLILLDFTGDFSDFSPVAEKFKVTIKKKGNNMFFSLVRRTAQIKRWPLISPLTKVYDPFWIIG